MPEHSQFRHCARSGGGGGGKSLRGSHTPSALHTAKRRCTPQKPAKEALLSQPMNFSRVSKCIEVQLKPLALTAAAEES